MKLRLAWIADPEDVDTYSAKETRVLLRALARRKDVVPLWFARGSAHAPHLWNGVRVFPIPAEGPDRASFLETLIAQQKPHVLFSNVPLAEYGVASGHLDGNSIAWIQRDAPAVESGCTRTATLAAAPVTASSTSNSSGTLPFLSGVAPDIPNGEEPTALLAELEDFLAREAPARTRSAVRHPAHLIMRQQLFCNASLAHVMFELTNALIEAGFPAVAQDEHASLAKAFIHKEEDLFRAGAPAKYDRVLRSLRRDYDPETSTTVHFSMLEHGGQYSWFGTFSSLTPREVLYTTGNHSVTRDAVRRLEDCFEKLLAPSWHVLRPYLEAGLDRTRGAVVPHGVDPEIFCPEAAPLQFPTEKGFRFLQTSFPWVLEKGFDLTIRAYCRAFSCRDDVTLVLRVPEIRNQEARSANFGRLAELVREARDQPGGPEILLVEQDVPLNRRGGIYTGADCYVFPLRAEGFGMTILEAMACGLPVIATPWSGPADFLSPRWAYTLRHSGLVPERTTHGSLLRYHVEPDLEHLVHLMRHLYKHRDEATDLGRAASRVARDHWTWRHAAAKLAATLGMRPEQEEPHGATVVRMAPAEYPVSL